MIGGHAPGFSLVSRFRWAERGPEQHPRLRSTGATLGGLHSRKLPEAPTRSWSNSHHVAGRLSRGWTHRITSRTFRITTRSTRRSVRSRRLLSQASRPAAPRVTASVGQTTRTGLFPKHNPASDHLPAGWLRSGPGSVHRVTALPARLSIHVWSWPLAVQDSFADLSRLAAPSASHVAGDPPGAVSSQGQFTCGVGCHEIDVHFPQSRTVAPSPRVALRLGYSN